MKNIVRRIGWFFEFVWYSIIELSIKDNWEIFTMRIYLYNYEEPKKNDNNSINKRISISGVTVEIVNDINLDKLEPRLTEEEFKSGKSGYIWMDKKTGKLNFRK